MEIVNDLFAPISVDSDDTRRIGHIRLVYAVSIRKRGRGPVDALDSKRDGIRIDQKMTAVFVALQTYRTRRWDVRRHDCEDRSRFRLTRVSDSKHSSLDAEVDAPQRP